MVSAERSQSQTGSLVVLREDESSYFHLVGPSDLTDCVDISSQSALAVDRMSYSILYHKSLVAVVMSRADCQQLDADVLDEVYKRPRRYPPQDRPTHCHMLQGKGSCDGVSSPGSMQIQKHKHV